MFPTKHYLFPDMRPILTIVAGSAVCDPNSLIPPGWMTLATDSGQGTAHSETIHSVAT